MTSAKELGSEYGYAVASWFEIRDEDQAVRVLKGIEDGDPVVMDMQPAPLSGEWADSWTPAKLADELSVTDPDALSESVEEFETAFGDAFWDSIQTQCRYQLPPELQQEQ